MSEYYQRTLRVVEIVRQRFSLQQLLIRTINLHRQDPYFPTTSPRRIDGRNTEREGIHHSIYRFAELQISKGDSSLPAALKIANLSHQEAYHFQNQHYVAAQLGALEAKLETREYHVPPFTIVLLYDNYLSLLTADLTENGYYSLRPPKLVDRRITGMLFYAGGVIQSNGRKEQLVWCDMTMPSIVDHPGYQERGKKYLSQQALVVL